MYNLIFSLIIILSSFSKLSYCQSNQLRVNTNESYIKYLGDHLLHSWEGTNNKVNGLAVLDSKNKSLQKLAILLYVRDFDSQNSGRDAHALEVRGPHGSLRHVKVDGETADAEALSHIAHLHLRHANNGRIMALARCHNGGSEPCTRELAWRADGHTVVGLPVSFDHNIPAQKSNLCKVRY